jgi:hypothetical protein
MIIDLTAVARVVPLTALMLAACRPRSADEKGEQERKTACSQATSKQAEMGNKP